MNYSSQHRRAQSRGLASKVSTRLRDLAEAGATGGQLSPREVKEICEALRAQNFVNPTRFHGGAGC